MIPAVLLRQKKWACSAAAPHATSSQDLFSVCPAQEAADEALLRKRSIEEAVLRKRSLEEAVLVVQLQLPF